MFLGLKSNKIMAESSTRKAGCIKKDIISELPPNILETILCFMPLQDAVRTSILSRKWRHCWTMMPHLSFDDEFFDSMWDNLSQYDDRELRAHKFVSVINKVLLLHNGPILSFSLNFPGDCDAQIVHEYIDQWITLFLRIGIKQLFLWDPLSHEFTTHQFSSLDLTHLRLLSIWFPYTPGRFTHLTSLELVDATSNFGQSVFDCPVLEKLTLVMCKGLFHTNFRAPNLKCLVQIYSQITLEYSLAGLEKLAEYAFMLSYDPEEYAFMLSHNPEMHIETSNVIKVLGSLQNIEKFSIAKCFIKHLAAGGSPNRLSKPLLYLKTLNICDVDFTDLSEISCLLCLIRSAPNLCKLHISGGPNLCVKGDLKNYWIEDSEDCTVDHLEIFTFSHFSGLRAELGLVKFLLARSPLLKTMFIHCSKDIEKGAALTMTNEMLQYSRASSRAVIKHLEHPVRIHDFYDELWNCYDVCD